MKKVFFIINIILSIISFLYGISILNVNSGSLFYLIWFLISAFFIIIDLLIYFKVFEKYLFSRIEPLISTLCPSSSPNLE